HSLVGRTGTFEFAPGPAALDVLAQADPMSAFSGLQSTSTNESAYVVDTDDPALVVLAQAIELSEFTDEQGPLEVLAFGPDVAGGAVTANGVIYSTRTTAKTAVHKVYAVAVTPNNRGDYTASQLPAARQAAVAAANQYWSAQSGGKITFT